MLTSTTRAHFSASRRMRSAACSGVLGTNSRSIASILARTSVCASAEPKAWFKAATTAGGVPLGASSNCPKLASKPATPASLIVGSSIATGERRAEVTAKPISVPALACGMAAVVAAGSINAAARKLGVSQPGLTKSLGSLEAELDALLLRGGAVRSSQRARQAL